MLQADARQHGPDWLPVAGSLTEAELKPIVAEAIARWARTGLSETLIAKMAGASVMITHLQPGYLGLAVGNSIYLDDDAGQRGWFVDPTPGRDEEFASSCDQRGVDSRVVDRVDLLSVVEHELGHLIGLSDLGPADGGLMSGSLATGRRVVPGQAEIDAVFSLAKLCDLGLD